MIKKFDQMVVAYTKWVIHWRWPVLLVTIPLVFFIASGGRFLKFDTNYRVFFSEDNPQLQAFEAVQNIYTKNDNLLFVFEPADGNVFTNDNLKIVEEFTQDAWKIPYAIRVDAITNFQHTEAFDDDLIVADLISGAGHLTEQEIAKARTVALNEPQLLNRLVPSRTHVTGVNVTIQLPEKDQQKAVPETVAYARTLAQSYRDKYPGLNVYQTGVVMLNNAFSEAGINDLSTLVPLMYVAMFVFMILILRSISGTIATILIVLFSAITAMGLAGWVGIGLVPISAQAPTMIMTLAIADSVHILVIMLREMRRGVGKREAIVESMRVNMSPIFLTSLTTAIGFLSMNFSHSPPFWHLGNITATGVTFAFFYSVLLLPALMTILPVKVKQTKEQRASLIDRLAEFIIAKRSPLLWGTGLAILAISVFIPRNALNDQFVEYFDDSIQFRRDTDFTTQNLSGLYQIQFSLRAAETGGISNPEYLEKLEEFTQWFRSQPEVLHVSSFSTVMKRINKSMNADDVSYYSIPENRELAAQYLLLYELSLPFGLDLNNQINIDKSATRFIVTVKDISANELRGIAGRAEQWLSNNAPPSMFAYGVGPAIMFAHISQRNVHGMLKGTTAALVLISLCLIIALRSLKFGLLSLIPNLIPAALAFGVWGLWVARINIGLSVVMGMTLGIVVDDTVHFLSKYLRARRERNLDAPDAVRYAFSTVGLALVVTSAILTVGFLILSLSAFDMNAGMGKLTAITIVFALLADFFFLPALLIKIEERKLHGSTEFILSPSQGSP